MESPTIVVDSSSDQILFNGTQWEEEKSNNTFGGSQYVCHTERAADDDPFLSFTFHGKSVEIYGTLDRELGMRPFVDNAVYNPLDETRGAPSGRRGVKLFEAGVLSGRHVVRLLPDEGQLIVDYILYTPVGKTSFDGEALIFDDSHMSLNYTGTWNSIAFPELNELPFNNTLMSTTESGASFSFAFTGSSITVFGGLQSNTTGVVSAEFSIDGSTPSTLILANQTRAGTGWTLHRQFSQHNITENANEVHVLNGKVLQASESQPFLLDYVVVRGNEHTQLAEREFQKSGSRLNGAGMTIGLVIMAIAIVIVLWVSWSYYRKRKKAKGLPPSKN